MDDFSNWPVCFTLIVNNLLRPEDGIIAFKNTMLFFFLWSSVTDMCVFVLHIANHVRYLSFLCSDIEQGTFSSTQYWLNTQERH